MNQVAESLERCDIGSRRAALVAEFVRLEIDALLITDLNNVGYLTGFTGSAALLLVTAESMTLATDGRYGIQAAAQSAAAEVEVSLVIGAMADQMSGLVSAAEAARCTSIGLEADSVTWAGQREWVETFGKFSVVPTTGAVGALRSIKDAGEVARIEAAAGIADGALSTVIHLLGLGVTEREFARALDYEMLQSGADGLSFETICASGPNSALPHARPGNRTIGEGELVILDFGAIVDGYHSDMTRTFHLGEPDDETGELLDVVVKAQAAGVAAVSAGVGCDRVDAACRDYIIEAGLGELFIHGTGHGVGRVIHEAPWVNSRNPAPLVSGQVVTVEPGVYRPGLGGVRIEDTVLVTDRGARRLTTYPKDPVLAT
ncbi:MAG: Xaa-Pro aminopeptidase [Candidatus Poriferisodalaceae bacterium]|jgi:Xaa-Pro aminopeptidase